MQLSRLNIRLDPSLTQGFLDAEFHRVLPNCGIALGDDDDLAVQFGSLVGKRLHDLVVDIVPILPRKSVDLDSYFVEAALALDDGRTAAPFLIVFVGTDN